MLVCLRRSAQNLELKLLEFTRFVLNTVIKFLSPPVGPRVAQLVFLPSRPKTFSNTKNPTNQGARGEAPIIGLALGTNREGRERVKIKASRIQSIRLGSALVCVRRNVQHRELKLPESTRFVLSTIVMIAVSTDGPTGCLVSPPPLSPQNIHHTKKPQQAMGLAAAQRTDYCWLLLFLLLQCPGLGWVGAKHRKSRQNKKTWRDSYPGPRWRGLSCRDGLSPSRTFPPLAVPSLAVSPLVLPFRSAILAGPLLSRAGGARSMPPNPAQKVLPVAHNVPPGLQATREATMQLQRLSSAAGFRLTPSGRCVRVCLCVCSSREPIGPRPYPVIYAVANPGRVSDGSRLALYTKLSLSMPFFYLFLACALCFWRCVFGVVFLFLSFCRFVVFLFSCSRWSFVDVLLIFSRPADQYSTRLATASRPSEHPPVREKIDKTFRWVHRLQIQNLFIAFKRDPR